MCIYLYCSTDQLECSQFICCHICLPLGKLLEIRNCVSLLLRTVPDVQQVFNKSLLHVFSYCMQSNLAPLLFTTLNGDIKHVRAICLTKIIERAVPQQRDPSILTPRRCFMPRMLKEKPASSYVTRDSKHTWNWGRSLQSRVWGAGPPRPGHSAPRSCWQLSLQPKSSLCSPTKAGRIAFICHIQVVDLSLCVYLLVSHLRKEISFLYSEFPGLESPRSST